MIRLSEDKKSVLNISTFEELEERPGFTKSLDVRESPIKEVIGVYTLPEKVPCGISTCHTGHLRGYLTVVKGGQEICVGNVCGKKHFGTDWTEAKDAFQIIANAARFRENIDLAKYKSGDWSERILRLAEDCNANGSVYKNMRIQMGSALPGIVQEKLKIRAKSGNSFVTRARAATADEREIAEATTSGGASSNFVEDTLYLIRGLAAVNGHAKLRQIEVSTLQQDIGIFSNLDSESLNFSDLKYWNRWQGQMDSVLDDLEKIHAECVRFLEPSNLASLRSYSSSL